MLITRDARTTNILSLLRNPACDNCLVQHCYWRGGTPLLCHSRSVEKRLLDHNMIDSLRLHPFLLQRFDLTNPPTAFPISFLTYIIQQEETIWPCRGESSILAVPVHLNNQHRGDSENFAKIVFDLAQDFSAHLARRVAIKEVTDHSAATFG